MDLGVAIPVGMKVSAAAIRRAQAGLGTAFKNVYEVECLDADGKLKWRDRVENLVTNEGLNDILTNYWKGAAYTASFFVGLTDGTPTVAAGDTLAAHAGWTEITAYTGDRQALTLGAVASQSVDNSASKASFPITGTATVGGAFIATVANGTAGVLVGAGAFSGGDKGVASGDTLNVTATLTAATA